MRDGWVFNQFKDAREFSQNPSDATSLLDHSSLGELKDLGFKEWQLFDGAFGSGKERKQMFFDRLDAIIRV